MQRRAVCRSCGRCNCSTRTGCSKTADCTADCCYSSGSQIQQAAQHQQAENIHEGCDEPPHCALHGHAMDMPANMQNSFWVSSSCSHRELALLSHLVQRGGPEAVSHGLPDLPQPTRLQPVVQAAQPALVLIQCLPGHLRTSRCPNLIGRQGKIQAPHPPSRTCHGLQFLSAPAKPNIRWLAVLPSSAFICVAFSFSSGPKPSSAMYCHNAARRWTSWVCCTTPARGAGLTSPYCTVPDPVTAPAQNSAARTW